MARKTGKPNLTATKAARTRRRRAAGLKAAATKRRKAVARKAATTRRRRSAGRKSAATKKRKAAARKAVETRRRASSRQTSDVVAVPIAVETFSAEVLTTTVAGDEVQPSSLKTSPCRRRERGRRVQTLISSVSARSLGNSTRRDAVASRAALISELRTLHHPQCRLEERPDGQTLFAL